MNKKKFSMLMKSKGFYLSLLTGILAVLALCIVVVNQNDNSAKKENLAELNGKKPDLIAQSSTAPADNTQTKNQEKSDKTSVNQKTEASNKANIEKDSRLENDVETEADEKGIIIQNPADNSTKADESKKEDATVAVTTQSDKVKNSLEFDQEKGLAWPVKGNVIMNYSMDKGVYFSTLGQYKCNPAIVIDVKAGTKVKCSTKSIVTNIKKNEETGWTVTTDIGNGFSVVYGQLEKPTVKKGDTLKEGSTIGVVAKPTKYYSVEGDNLYYQVLEKEETVNPMLLLR